MYDSLNYVDDNCCVNVEKLEKEVSDREHVQMLAAVKHKEDIELALANEWSKMVCSDTDYIEAITQDEIKTEHIRTVYIKKSTFNQLYIDIFSELEKPIGKWHLSGIDTIFEKLIRHYN